MGTGAPWALLAPSSLPAHFAGFASTRCAHAGVCHSPGTGRSCHKPLQQLLQTCLHPSQGSGLCWSRGRSLPVPLWISLPVLCAAAEGTAWAGGVRWSRKAGAVRTPLPPTSCDKAHFPLVLLSSPHRSLQEKRTLPPWHGVCLWRGWTRSGQRPPPSILSALISNSIPPSFHPT